MSDINIVTDNLEDNIENIPESGEFTGSWDIPLDEILTNINTYLNLLKNNDTEHALSEDNSLMSDGEVGLWSEKLLVDVGNNSTRQIVTCETLEGSGSPVLEMTEDAQEVLVSTARPCLIHRHEGDKNHFYKACNPEVINSHSIFPSHITQALYKAIPYLLLHYVLGNSSGINESDVESCFKEIEVPEYIKKNIIGLIGYLNTEKANLRGDNNTFFTKPLNLKWTRDRNVIPETESSLALDFKSAETRYSVKTAKINTPNSEDNLGLVKVGRGFEIDTSGQLSVLNPYNLTWASNITAVAVGSTVTITLDTLNTRGILSSVRYNVYGSTSNISQMTYKTAELQELYNTTRTITFTNLTRGTTYHFIALCRGIESRATFYSAAVSVTVPS